MLRDTHQNQAVCVPLRRIRWRSYYAASSVGYPVILFSLSQRAGIPLSLIKENCRVQTCRGTAGQGEVPVQAEGTGIMAHAAIAQLDQLAECVLQVQGCQVTEFCQKERIKWNSREENCGPDTSQQHLRLVGRESHSNVQATVKWVPLIPKQLICSHCRFSPRMNAPTRDGTPLYINVEMDIFTDIDIDM